MIVAFSGISGSGKSTMARLLAQRINAQAFIEPEEREWPLVVRKRDTYGAATALLALRQGWITQYVQADQARSQGQLALIDTYYFKTTSYYLDKPGMDWLMPTNDPYCPLIKNMFALDRTEYPDADRVVLFDIAFSDWQQLLKARGRAWDTPPGLYDLYVLTSTYIAQATEQHCAARGIPMLHFKQKCGNPDEQAVLLEQLVSSSY